MALCIFFQSPPLCTQSSISPSIYVRPSNCLSTLVATFPNDYTSLREFFPTCCLFISLQLPPFRLSVPDCIYSWKNRSHHIKKVRIWSPLHKILSYFLVICFVTRLQKKNGKKMGENIFVRRRDINECA